MDSIHLISEVVVAVALVSAGVWALAAQARRNRAALRAVLEQQSEALALQAELVASRHARGSGVEKGTLQGLGLY